MNAKSITKNEKGAKMSTEELLAQLPEAKYRMENAAAQDDPVGMVDTYITYNQRLSQLRQISPLEFLQKGDQYSALAHADVYEADHAILWHLLFVWELKEAGRIEDALAIYQRLKFKKFSRGVLDHHSDIATIILSQVIDLDEDVTCFLCRNAFTFYTYNSFLHELIDLGCSSAYRLAERLDGKRLRESIESQREAKKKSAAGTEAKPAIYNSDDILRVKEIEDLKARAGALSDIAIAMAAASDFVTALDIADAIEEYETQQRLLVDIAIAQAKSGNVATAFDTLKRFDVGFPSNDALLAISAELIRSGDTARARETIVHVLMESIQSCNEFELVEALRDALAFHLKEGQSNPKINPRIKLVLSGIIAYARTITNKRTRAKILIDVACAQGNIGENDEALKTMESAMIATILIRDEYMLPGFSDLRIKDVLDLAKGQEEIGLTEAAKKTRGIAMTAAHAISDPQRCTYSLISIGKDQIALNDLDLAKETLMNASNIAHKIINKSDRDWTIEKIVENIAEAELFPEAMKIALSIETENFKSLALREIACIAAQKGLISYAYEIREQNTNEIFREQIFGCIAAAYAKQGDYASANSVVAQMESKADTLLAIGSAQVRRGDYEQAAQSLSLSCDDTVNWADDLLSVNSIACIACAQVEAGLGSQALQTAARINVLQYIYLPDVAAAFAVKRDKVSFKKLLIECVNFEDTIHRVIGLIARLYPDSAIEIMELLLQRLDEKYQFSG
jgi:hypothetical protein